LCYCFGDILKMYCHSLLHVIINNPKKMKKVLIVWMVFAGIGLIVSCNNAVRSDEKRSAVDANEILQQKDGTISLKIDKAECYHDMVNPTSNTAEWNVVVSKSGRYDVWLSSATIDTTDMKYKNSVLLSIRDNRLETLPIVNRVIQNSSDVSRPYYQADSFMGSLYIQDTGVYSVQVISDKILPKDFDAKGSASDDQTKIVSVSLTPAKH
jgi:hypothetical protein